jgi:hypothetical protein
MHVIPQQGIFLSHSRDPGIESVQPDGSRQENHLLSDRMIAFV